MEAEAWAQKQAAIANCAQKALSGGERLVVGVGVEAATAVVGLAGQQGGAYMADRARAIANWWELRGSAGRYVTRGAAAKALESAARWRLLSAAGNGGAAIGVASLGTALGYYIGAQAMCQLDPTYFDSMAAIK